jgi:hypothetical protein
MKTRDLETGENFGTNLARHTRAHLAEVARAPVRACREHTASLLRKLAAKPGAKALLGHTEWNEPVEVPLEYLVQAHARALPYLTKRLGFPAIHV